MSPPPAAGPPAGFLFPHFHSGHNSVDIANAAGTPPHAAGGGEVAISAGDNTADGQWMQGVQPPGRRSEYGRMWPGGTSAGAPVAGPQNSAL
ncbi:Peptidase M23 domain-containing protein OS=Streptomyces microflavus OX=1919 GN=Smic_63750 PE=4 SV=1 [Streptomyces microflavus]